MTPWELPAAQALFGAVEEALSTGVAVIAADAAMPPGLEAALRTRLAGEYHVETVNAAASSPTAAIAEAFGAEPRVDALAAPALDQMAALVDGRTIPPEDLADWATFLPRLRDRRSETGVGLVVAVVDAPEGLDRAALRWSDRFRRIDCLIWADTHLPHSREGLAASLASGLAVELCGWRLDLAQTLVRASVADLADPLAWLARRPEPPIPEARCVGATAFACPLALRGRNEATLRRRVWQAHLPALFPVLEDARIRLIETHRRHLRIDDHLADLGVTEVDEIELGGLAWQLADRLGQGERLSLACLARIRNRLAHRQPADPDDLMALL